GVRPRVAWHWMWLLQTGYCYLLQAGSISNDLFSAVYALAAVDFALRASKSGRISEVCLSLLSAALLTGAKPTNLPLLLPWAFAFVPTCRVWLPRPPSSFGPLSSRAGDVFPADGGIERHPWRGLERGGCRACEVRRRADLAAPARQRYHGDPRQCSSPGVSFHLGLESCRRRADPGLSAGAVGQAIRTGGGTLDRTASRGRGGRGVRNHHSAWPKPVGGSQRMETAGQAPGRAARPPGL